MATRVLKDKIKTVSKLNDRQKEFCRNYTKTMNGLVSYREAYGNKQTDGTCKVRACQYLKRPEFKAYINELMDSYKDSVDITIGEIVCNLKKIALGGKNVRDADKLKALEILGKYLGLFTVHTDITSNGSSITVTLED